VSEVESQTTGLDELVDLDSDDDGWGNG